jgi:hypothetical protein
LTPRASFRRVLLAVALAPLLPVPAVAQDTPDREPIGRFAADLRGAMPRFKQDPAIADAAGVVPANLATRGLGIVAGAHVYPLRFRKVTLGLGGEVLASGASNTLEPTTEGDPDGPTARTRFSALSPQLSLNFGSRAGWSYISGGIGWATFEVEQADVATSADGSTRRSTVNYGGGARWFAKAHLAVSIDLRFYAVGPLAATPTQPGMPRMTLMILSAGVSLR